MSEQEQIVPPVSEPASPELPPPEGPPPWGYRLSAWLARNRHLMPTQWRWRAIRRLALVVVLVFAAWSMQRYGIKRINENQVGVLVNNLTGSLTLKERAGYHVFVPYFMNMHALDKTLQKIDLSWKEGGGGITRDVKLKTADGCNVSLDVTINYKLIPETAVRVLQQSGDGLKYAQVWMEPYTRQICLSTFGQLQTEDIYETELRNAKARAVQEELNRLLNPQGIEVVAVIAGEFRFYKEYEQIIQEKKLSDQLVEEQQAQARASLEDQERQVVEADTRSRTRLAAFSGECEKRLVDARAEEDKIRLDADGYYVGAVMAADAALYSASAQATGMRARMLADAEGMERMRHAMSGSGGVGMVGLQYAKRLKDIQFAGTPMTHEAHVQQLTVDPMQAAPASIRAPRPAGPPAPAAFGGTP